MTQPHRQFDLFHDCAAELSADERKTIRQAFKILERALRTPGAAMTTPELVADYMKLNITTRPYEVFIVMFLDSQNRMIETQQMFRGTINQASVYPREIVKEALRLNASGCILAHNHPSGIAEPSHADQEITKKIKDALQLVEINVLDHFIIGGLSHLSFAEKGLMP